MWIYRSPKNSTKVLNSHVADPNTIAKRKKIAGTGKRRRMTDISERWRKKEKRIWKKHTEVSTKSLYLTVFCYLYILLHLEALENGGYHSGIWSCGHFGY